VISVFKSVPHRLRKPLGCGPLWRDSIEANRVLREAGSRIPRSRPSSVFSLADYSKMLRQASENFWGVVRRAEVRMLFV